MLKKDVSQAGRSLIEMLATITIITMITMGAIQGSSLLMRTFYPITVKNDLEQASVDIKDMYLWRKGYTNVNMSFLCQNKVFKCTDGDKVTNPWGGTITVSSKNFDAFELTLSDVPKRACTSLLGMEWVSIFPKDTSCSAKQDMVFTSVGPQNAPCTGDSCGTNPGPDPDPSPDYCAGVSCNGHGSCNSSTGKCVCSGGWTGSYCATPPNLCLGWTSSICQPLCDSVTGSKTNAPNGTACTMTDYSSGYCDGKGACVASKCAGWTATTCQPKCDNVTGNKTNAASGTTCTVSTYGDGVCDGNGGCIKDLCKNVTCSNGVECDPNTGKCICSFSCPEGRKPDSACATCVCNDPTMVGEKCDIKTNCPSSSSSSASPSSPANCRMCPNKGVIVSDQNYGTCYGCDYLSPIDMGALINDPIYGCKAVCGDKRYANRTYCIYQGTSCPTSSSNSSSLSSPQACKACSNKGVVNINGYCYGCDYLYSIDMGDLSNDPIYGCKAVCPNRWVNETYCNYNGTSCPTSSSNSSSLSSPQACKACSNKGVVNSGGYCYGCDYLSPIDMGALINDPIYGCKAVCGDKRYANRTYCIYQGGVCPSSSSASSDGLSPQACAACPNKGIVSAYGQCYRCDYPGSIRMGPLLNDPVYGCTTVCGTKRRIEGTECVYQGGSQCPPSSWGVTSDSSPQACKVCSNKGVVDTSGTCYGCGWTSPIEMGSLVNDPVYGCTAVCPNRAVYGMYCNNSGTACPSSNTYSAGSSPVACKACPSKGVVDVKGGCAGCNYSYPVKMGSLINDPVYGCTTVCPNRYVIGTDCYLG